MSKALPIIQRPVTRGDCANVPRPCPFKGCRYHLRHGKHYGQGGYSLSMQDAEAIRASWEWGKTEKLAQDYGVSVRTVQRIVNGRTYLQDSGANYADKPSCSLDVADDGEHSCAEVGEILGISAQAVSVVELRAIRKLRHLIDGLDMTDYLADGPEGFTEPDHSGYDSWEDE